MKTPRQELIAFSLNTALPDVPQSALHILKLSLLDWFAVAIAGTQEPASRIIRQMVTAEAGTQEATVIGQSTRLPARAAALANGTTAHALDYDDTHFLHIGHPSVTIFPAALAMAEKQRATGAGFLLAALTGYESSCRIGHWFGRSHYEAGFHMTATAGTFGATLAASRLSGLTEHETAQALGLAATRACGLKAQFGTMGKPFNAGMAAANGVEAAQLAALGFTSNPDALLSFAQSHAAEMPALETVLNGLGTHFVLEQVHHKYHACCHGLHAMLEAMALLIQSRNPDPNLLKTIDIQTNPRWLNVCNNPHPQTGLEAKFSYRQTAAMALSGIDTGALSSFTDHLCKDAEITALRDKTTVTGSAELSDTAARVSLVFPNSSPLEMQVDLATPQPPKQREIRVLAKAETLLGQDQAQAIWQEINNLEQAKDLAKLLQIAGKIRA
jgi:2-methylcitrate dehydratase PrpD